MVIDWEGEDSLPTSNSLLPFCQHPTQEPSAIRVTNYSILTSGKQAYS